jgi:DNA-binding NarL/FixJ family response regulator
MPEPLKPVRVFLFDEHLAVREGLRRLFEDTPLEAKYEAPTPDELFKKLPRSRFDLLVMEPRTQGRRDLALLETVLEEKPDAHVLIYTGPERLPFIAKCYRQGALGFVSKVADSSTLIAGALTVARGEQYFSPGVAQEIASYKISPREAQDPTLLLDAKLLRIFVELAAGRSTDEVARSMSLAEKTVQNLVPKICMKLGDVPRTSFHAIAEEYGLIEASHGPELETHAHAIVRSSVRNESRRL